ncbi:hypothetical protein ACH5RR_008793 [Cinchona calisaya]|uniref:Uncharacterized protein n=1 Tax=Cinchona calisaya TaxID=153742 RepID=A0ABD3ACC2_9GENT
MIQNPSIWSTFTKSFGVGRPPPFGTASSFQLWSLVWEERRKFGFGSNGKVLVIGNDNERGGRGGRGGGFKSSLEGKVSVVGRGSGGRGRRNWVWLEEEMDEGEEAPNLVLKVKMEEKWAEEQK